MKRCLASIGAVLALGTIAHAQPQIGSYQPPINNPAFSPYLNLNNRGGTNAAINYFGIVQPQMQMQNAIQQLQGQVTTTQDALTAGQALAPVTTGHGVQFMNSTPYFMRPAVSLPGTSGMATAATATAATAPGIRSLRRRRLGLGEGASSGKRMAI